MVSMVYARPFLSLIYFNEFLSALRPLLKAAVSCPRLCRPLSVVWCGVCLLTHRDAFATAQCFSLFIYASFLAALLLFACGSA